MAEIGYWALPRKDSKEYARIIDHLRANRTPAVDKSIRKIADRAHALHQIQLLNGAGLPLDTTIREYNCEYNNRVFNHSLHDMPTSFNIMEAFNKFLPPSATFKIRKEKDYLVSFVDYLDFFTSENFDTDLKEITRDYEEGVIYNYNGTHDPRELFFKCTEGSKFCVLGVSLVRTGNEVNVVMLAGQECDLQSETETLTELGSALPHKNHIQPDPSLKKEAAALLEGENLWRTVVLSRLDLKSGSLDVRYVAKDCGNHYRIITDDIGCMLNSNGEFLNPEFEEVAKKSLNDITEYQALFEFIKVCLRMGQYIHHNEDSASIQRHPTKLRTEKRTKKLEKLIKAAPATEIIYFRDVLSIPEAISNITSQKSILAPHVKTETSGYWKTLPYGAKGRGKSGQEIFGRTWVEKTLSWVESTKDPEVLTVSISPNNKKITGDDPGHIYVMRCAAHGKNIFKIGLSRRTADIRASELTSSTSAPDQFLVVDDWEVGNCYLAEKLIHKKLEEYRFNSNREFFRTSYKIIHKAVLDTIEHLES